MRPVTYASLLAVGWLMTLSNVTALGAEKRAGHIYALLVIDTDAEDAPYLGVPVDGARMLTMLEQAFQMKSKGPRSKLIDIKVLENTEAKPDAIRSYIDGLPDIRHDTLLFYYSGHGGTDKRNHQQFLSMRQGSLYRDDLIKWIKRKSPYFTIVISDCCSNYPDVNEGLKAARGVGIRKGAPGTNMTPSAARDGARLKTTIKVDPPNVNWHTLDSLFFLHTGILDITAALPGDWATGNRKRGGRFTRNLIKILGEGGEDLACPDGFVLWTTVASLLLNETQLETGAQEDEGLVVIPVERPDLPNLGNGIEGNFVRTSPTALPAGFGVEAFYPKEGSNPSVPKKYLKNIPPKRTPPGNGILVEYQGPPSIMLLNEGWPAEKAGLKEGDYILEIDNKPMNFIDDVYKAVRESNGIVTVKVGRIGDDPPWEEKRFRVEIPYLLADY